MHGQTNIKFSSTSSLIAKIAIKINKNFKRRALAPLLYKK